MAQHARSCITNHFVGIDFGTTNSLIGYIDINDRDRFVLVESLQGNSKTPSCVAFSSEGCLVGNPALNYLTVDPKNSIYGIKRLVGLRNVKTFPRLSPYEIIGKDIKLKLKVNHKGEQEELFVEEIIAKLLSHMKYQLEKKLARKIEHAVMTVPAHFFPQQRQALLDAATIAGLQLQLVNDSTVLAFKYLQDKTFTGCKNVLIFIFGGGSIDVSIFTMDRDGCRLKASKGKMIGGLDIDDHLVHDLINEANSSEDIRNDNRRMQRLMRETEKAKIILSTAPVVPIEIPISKKEQSRKHFTRESLIRSTQRYLMDIECLINKTLEHSNTEVVEISEIILSGGSTRIPWVKKMLHELFPEKTKIITAYQADETLVEGAAMMACSHRGEKPNQQDLNFWTGSSASLSLEFGKHNLTIEGSRPVPYEWPWVILGGWSDNDREIKVYAERCNYIGSFYLDGVSPNASALKLDLQVDLNGVLKLQANMIIDKLQLQLHPTSSIGILDSSDISRCKDKMLLCMENDKIQEDFLSQKNQLEEWAFKYKNKLSNPDKTFGLTEDKCKDIKTKCQDILDTVEDITTGEHLNNTLNEKIKLTRVIDEYEEAEEDLYETTQRMKQAIIKEGIDDDDDKRKIINVCEESEIWLEQNKPRSTKEIRKAKKSLERDYNKIEYDRVERLLLSEAEMMLRKTETLKRIPLEKQETIQNIISKCSDIQARSYKRSLEDLNNERDELKHCYQPLLVELNKVTDFEDHRKERKQKNFHQKNEDVDGKMVSQIDMQLQRDDKQIVNVIYLDIYTSSVKTLLLTRSAKSYKDQDIKMVIKRLDEERFHSFRTEKNEVQRKQHLADLKRFVEHNTGIDDSDVDFMFLQLNTLLEKIEKFRNENQRFQLEKVYIVRLEEIREWFNRAKRENITHLSNPCLLEEMRQKWSDLQEVATRVFCVQDTVTAVSLPCVNGVKESMIN